MAIADMFNEATVLRLRVIVYCALVFFSFFIFIGAAVMKDEAGWCPLYYDGKVSSQSNCNYPLAIAVIFQLLYTLFRIVLLVLFLLGKFTPDMFFFSNVMELVYLAVDTAALLLTFIGACILSAGHNSTCDHVYCGSGGWVSASKAAQAGAWISTFLWIFIVVIGFIFMMRAGKLPFFGGSSASAATGDSSAKPAGESPPMDTPPNYPDDSPKY